MTITAETVISDVSSFLSDNIRDDEIVIGLLRYGAHLPHVYQKYNADAKDVTLLLSHMVYFQPPEYFRHKRFLILDDTVYRGIHMQRMHEWLIDRAAVEPSNIRCAALAVHRKERDGVLSKRTLNDVEYIVWKEELATIVRTDIRPTERDHPLYYFSSTDLTVGTLIHALQQTGEVHSTGPYRSGDVFRATLTLSSNVLEDLIPKLPGVEFDEICKLRFYTYEENGELCVVVVPIVLPIINLARAREAGTFEQIEKALRLPDGFFGSLSGAIGPLETVEYYFLTRALGAIVLERVLGHLAKELRQFGHDLKVVPAEKVDGRVIYDFPQSYRTFHSTVISAQTAAIAERKEVRRQEPLFPDTNWQPVRVETVLAKDPVLPDVYQLTSFISRHITPAVFNGVDWIPNYEIDVGVTHRQLLEEYRDPIFVSRALDELLDSGLLRAKDSLLDASTKTIGRTFLPGGEFKALAFIRLANAWDAVIKRNPEAVEVERRDLWGPF